MTVVGLIHEDGTVERHQLGDPPTFVRPDRPIEVREVFAAAHVVPRPAAENVPGAPADIDWDQTLAFRHHLWSWGMGVADAMDTAQRNMGLGPAAVEQLIRRSAAEARAVNGALVVGVGTDQLVRPPDSLEDIVRAYLDQLELAESVGAGVVLMASRHLMRAAGRPADYAYVYREVLRRAGSAVILHWLGEMFDPQLRGYFGSTRPREAAETLLQIIGENAEHVRGVKISLLDAELEIDLRARMPAGTTVFTGDDFNYVELIAGADGQHSNALLGAFAAFAPAASAALQRLADDDPAGYRAMLVPTEHLARQIFAPPTAHYKTGIAFLAWLNGHQSGFTMVAGLHATRSLPHLSEVLRRADAAGVIEDPERAAHRWRCLLAVGGIDAGPWGGPG